MKAQCIVSYFRNRVILLTGVALGILTGGCEEKYPDPLFTDSVIRGKIEFFFNTAGDPEPEDIKVTAFGPYKEKSAFTDQNGEFIISGLGNGTYRLEISKEGFGTKYQFGIQLFGSDTVGIRDELFERVNLSLPKLLTVETKNTSYTWLADDRIAITTNKTSGDVPARVFMAEYQDVSYKKYQWTTNVHSLKRRGYENLILTVHDIPFNRGQKIYLKLYICNPDEHYGYFNYHTGVWTFSTLEPDRHSDVMSFIMP